MKLKAWCLTLLFCFLCLVPQVGFPESDFQTTLKATERGDADAQYNLGFMYYKGRGVTQDYQEARGWFLKAAEQGYAKAQYNLGVMYYLGEGIPKDYQEARGWLLKAAEQGYAKAQYNLGVMYHDGEGGPQDYQEARRWYLKAAEQGDIDAQNNLGVLYASGQGDPKDYVTAYKWVSISNTTLNDKSTEAFLSHLEKEMTPEQIVEAQRQSNAWFVSHQKQKNTVD